MSLMSKPAFSYPDALPILGGLNQLADLPALKVFEFGFRISSFKALTHTLLTQRCFGPNLRCMADAKKKKKSRRKAVMVGLGLDSDGHKRLTTGPNFVLMGGSQETHEVMTEKAIKI